MRKGKTQMPLSITFLYPSKGVGGAQLLFIRLAKELSNNSAFSINVVDYSDGYLAKQLISYENIKILPFINGKVEIFKETIIVTPLSNFSDLQFLVSGDFSKIKLLLWSIHPSNLDYLLNSKGRRWICNKKVVKDYIQKLSENGNIVYMDEANFLAVKRQIQNLNSPIYLPIPLEINKDDFNNKPKAHLGKLNIGWIGRISYDKINSIKKIVDEISLLKNQENIVFHIIGIGERMNELKMYLNESKINYVFVGLLTNDNLDRYINQFIDLGISMGTSCLEFAAKKTPVAIIDYSLNKFPSVIRYNWLHETSFFTLGSDIHEAQIRNHTFRELIDQFKSNKELGEICFSYVVNNHDIKNISKLIEDHCLNLSEIDNNDFDRAQKSLNPYFYRIVYILLRKIKAISNLIFDK